MKKRCLWVPEKNEVYVKYHDEEWGVPVHDDVKHFEFLILEGAQAGLSWETILKRRSGYKKVYADFDVQKVAKFGEKKILEMLKDPRIIRNRLKVRGSVSNAIKFIELQKEFGSFDKYIWKSVGNKTLKHTFKELKDYPVYTEEAANLSKDLKKRGFTFVGPTIMYAHMQATGLVNDHAVDCFRYNEV